MDLAINKGRLAYVVGEMGNGGQERQLLYLLQQLSPVKKDVTVIVWHYRDDEYHAESFKALGLDLVTIDKEKSLLKRILQLRQIIKTKQPILLHSYTFYLNFYCWLACLGLKTIPVGGIRSRLTLHMHETGSILGALSIIFPTYKVSNNEFFAQGFKNAFLRSRIKKTHVITNHLDLNEFRSVMPAVAELFLTASIGRFTEEKRIVLIVEMISELKKRGLKVQHHHAGKGPLMDEVKKKITSLGMELDFILHGEISDVSSFLSDKHLFIHAAHSEGYPNVIMEAMACGKPIVTSDCGDVTNMIEQGVNGYIHEVDDIEGMINSCEQLIHNEEMLHSFAHYSRQIAEKKFDLDHLLEQTLKTYDKICVE